MEDAKPMMKVQEVRIVDGEERAFQCRKHRKLVVWPFDGRERRPDRFDFLATVKGFASDEQMRDRTCFDRVYVAPCDVLAKADEPAKQDRNVLRPDSDSPFAAVGPALADRPAALLDQPFDEGADGIGKRFLDRAS